MIFQIHYKQSKKIAQQAPKPLIAQPSILLQNLLSLTMLNGDGLRQIGGVEGGGLLIEHWAQSISDPKYINKEALNGL